MDQINWIAAGVAGVLGFFPGAVWYSNLMFLKPWQADMGISGNEGGGISMATRLVSGLILSVIAAVAFAFLLGPEPAFQPTLLKAVVVALGVITTSFGIQYLFEGRTVRVTAINGGYHLVQFLIFAVVLGHWH